MYVSRIVVRNFRNFVCFDATLQPGVTCIVGENNTGKTNLLHAIRLAVDANMSSYRRRLQVDDFPVGTNIRTPQHVLASLEFKDFASKENEEAMVFGCHVDDDVARLTYRFRPHRAVREAIKSGENPGSELTLEDYRWEIWGDGDEDPLTVDWDDDFGKWVKFEELQQSYLVVCMEALRDVEQRLRQSRSSPLAQLLTSADIPEKEQDALVAILRGANDKISASKTIKSVGGNISDAFDAAAGEAFTMGVKVGMGSPTFSDISRGLNVLLSNSAMQDFDPAINGLGLNNILYISMFLEYFERRVKEAKTAGQLLLIEEPEAHLHPQLQRVLLGALQRKSFQSIVTTHSTHITSQAPLASIIALTNDGSPATASTAPVADVPLTPSESQDLERYLDATRATLLYARKVMLVEGPTELFLIPALTKQVMGIDLDDKGISVVPIFGVHFAAFAKLFGPRAMTKRCAIVADGDLKPSDALAGEGEEVDEELEAIPKPDLQTLRNEYVEVFLCKTTFERAATHRGTLRMFAAAAQELGAPRNAKRMLEIWEALPPKGELSDEQAELLATARTKVLRTSKAFGKARFAQVASKHVNEATAMPPYIKKAVGWLLQN